MSAKLTKASLVLLKAAQNYLKAVDAEAKNDADTYLAGVATALHSQGFGESPAQLIQVSKKFLKGSDPWYGGDGPVWEFADVLDQLVPEVVE